MRSFHTQEWRVGKIQCHTHPMCFLIRSHAQSADIFISVGTNFFFFWDSTTLENKIFFGGEKKNFEKQCVGRSEPRG